MSSYSAAKDPAIMEPARIDEGTTTTTANLLFGKPPGLVAVIAGNAVVLIVAIIMGVVYWNILPSTIPAHFNWQGKADAYQSKTVLMLVYFVLTILGPLAFIVLGHLLPMCFSSASLCIPAREYWLNPDFSERQERAFAYLRFWMTGFGMAFGAYLVLFFAIVFHMASTGNHTYFFWYFSPLTVAYVLVVALAVYALYSHFANEPLREALLNYTEMHGYETFTTPSRIYYK